MKETKRDSGYAWVILLATWISTIIWAGVYASPSIYMLDWLEQFNASKAALGMVGGTQNGINYFSGLFVGPLVDRYGCRTVGMVGTFLTVLGLFSSAFATSIIWLYITYAVIAGIGTGWISMTAVLMVQYYFDKHRPFAAGFSLMGNGLGTFCILPLLRICITYYGWQGTMILHAGMVLHIFVLNMLYRPFDLSVIPEEKPHSQIKQESNNMKKDCTEKEIKPEKDVAPKKVFLSTKKCVQIFKSLWDFSIFKNPIYIQYSLAIVISQTAVVFMFRFISLQAHEKGLNKMESSMLPSIGGLSATISRITFSFVANCQCTNRILQCGFGGLGQGVIIMLSCLAWHFNSYIIFVTISGIFVGIQLTVSYTVMADLIGIKRLAQANSFLSMFIGVAILTALPLAGLIADITKNFEIAFYSIGALTCVAGIMILTVPFTQNRFQDQTSNSLDVIEEQKMTQTDAVKMYFSTESIHSVT